MRVYRVRARAMSDRRHVLSGYEHTHTRDLHGFVNLDRKEFSEILTCTCVGTRIGHGNVTIREEYTCMVIRVITIGDDIHVPGH